MSKSHDKMKTSKIEGDNLQAVSDFIKDYPIKISRQAVVNTAIRVGMAQMNKSKRRIKEVLCQPDTSS